jgi:DNA repair exonuclease SbcCD nuclease subunit
MMEQISNTEGAKVLVLAGDIFEYRRINKEVIDFFEKTC